MRRRRRWSFAAGPGDFLPIVIGSVMLFVSLPAVLLLLFNPDRNSGAIGTPLLILLGIGTILGAGFIVLGIQNCAPPGSRLYRIAHGRFFRP